MAGGKKAGRGRYTAAGYAYDEELEQESGLYIGRDGADFARELIRDNNRIGYSADALDEDGIPFSFFIEEAERGERREQESRERKQKNQTARRREEELGELTFAERFERALRRERHAAVVCGVLLALNLTLLAFFGQAVIDGVRLRDQILVYENGAAAYRSEIETANRKIAEATSGERIRNRAQNELGMLRGERVAKQTIYIQTYNLAGADTVAQAEEAQERGLLDWLLSVADIFDFKS